MLSQLYIENIAVIRKASLDFAPGLNVFTGETGAGKSILINAINAVLGARMHRDIIRSGESRAVVSALFSRVPETVIREIRELGYDAEDGQLLISRELDGETGKSVCRIGGRPATMALLRSVAGLLIDIHGQHDSQALLSPERHLAFIDGFGGLEGLLERYGDAYGRMLQAKEALQELQMDESHKLQRMDLLQYQTSEISAASLTDGEEEELTAQRDIIRNAEKIVGALGMMYDLLQGGEDREGILSQVEQLREELDTAGRYVEDLREYGDRVGDAVYSLEELSSSVRTWLDEYNFDPRQLDDIENRLDQIYRLKKKYGSSIGEILQYYETISQELEELTFSDQTVERLQKELDEETDRVMELARELSSRRRHAAEEFAARVGQELSFLDMPQVTLSFSQREKEPGPGGADALELLISANPGEEPRPLARIASGGELSRIMLAIKSVLADRDGVGTLIFDEVDAGVSGRAAQKIGLKLHQAAASRQVICVTHLAQVAAYGDYHSKICKTVEDGRTYTRIQPLSREERVKELARIMGGENITPISLQNADEMLTLAGN